MRRIILFTLLAIGLTGAGLGAEVVTTAAAAPEEPAGDTIVAVTGDQANGFEIEYYDGTSRYPPTDSEARAECGEYDKRVDRVRCRTEVRVWYRDLGDLQQALDWARGH
jgi:hypothetical protein